MNKKVVAIVAAGVLALLGVLVLLLWAKQADDRAYDGAKLTSVVRVTSTVPKGTASSDLGGSTEQVKVPSSTVPEGAVTDLSQVAGLVTNAQLEKGEVLLKARLVDPSSKAAEVGGVPRGLQEISISLDSQRLVGGDLKPGDTVGVLVTYDNATKQILDKVVVTKANFGSVSDEAQGQAIVTLAVTTAQAESITNAAEAGKVWLTKQNATTRTGGGAVTDSKTVLR